MAKRAPRPPRKAPTTRWGRFLVEQRLKRGWFQSDAFDHFRDKFAWGEDSRASYGNLERGTAEPDPDKAQVFLAEYGFTELPAEAVTDQGTQTPDLASALMALAVELRESRKERAALEVRIRVLEALAKRPSRSGGRGSQGRSVHPDSAG